MFDYGLELELKRAIFKKSYYQFFKWAFNILEPQTKLEDAFHIKYICDLLQKEVERIIRREAKGKDIIINIPPRTSKSKIVSQCLLPWIWIVAPHLKIIAVSFDEKLALSNAQYSKDIIKSREYQALFSKIFQIRGDSDSKQLFVNDKGGFRLSVTTGANITGFGAEIIIVDDPQNPKTADSEVERENTTKYYVEALYNRLTPINLGIRVIVQQRLHWEDLTGYLISKDKTGYIHINLPAEISADVQPKELIKFYKDGLLDPVRLNREELMKLKKQGSRYYAGQYMQTPSPDEGGIIKKAWFDILDPYTLTREPINEPVHFFLDSAYTAKTSNDPTAILACFKRNNDLIILDAQEQWLEFPDLIKFIVKYVNSYQLSENSRIFIEGAASGKSIVQQLRAITKLNVIEVEKPKDDKVTRANAITGKLEGRRAKVVKGNYVDNFLNQLAAFPNGIHDDMVDTLIHAVDQLLNGEDTPDLLWI